MATGTEGARIHLTVVYAHNGTSVLNEARTIVVGMPDAQGCYTIDWDLRFTPAGASVELDRTPLAHEPGGKSWGGYAGLSFRARPTTPVYTTADGKAEHGAPAPWMDLAVTEGDRVLGGVVICDHPRNPRHPTPWFLGSRSLPFLGAAPLFHGPLRIEAASPLRLRYRVIVHPGATDAAAIDRCRAAWLATP
jgi:hypothetical protein